MAGENMRLLWISLLSWAAITFLIVTYIMLTMNRNDRIGWLNKKLLKSRKAPEKELIEHKRTEEGKDKLVDDMEEQARRFNCLYGISKLAEQPNIPLEEVLPEAAKLISAAWQYPGITCARITFEGKKYQTDNFRSTEWGRSEDIDLNGEKAGTVEVYYTKQKPDCDKGPFLQKERGLLETLAKQLGKIIERNRLDEHIRKFSYAIEQSPVSIIIIDTDGKIEYVNPKYTQVTGYSFTDVHGQNLCALKLGMSSSEEYAEIWKTITSGNEWHGEFKSEKKNGELFWEYTSISPIKNEHGEITRYLSVKEDITRRKEIENQLKQIQTAVNDATDAILITNQKGEVVYINPAFGNLFKYSSEGADTIEFSSIFIDPKIAVGIYRGSLNGDTWTGEARMVSSSGRTFPAFLRSTPITDDRQNNLGVLFIINDITELKDAERRQGKLLKEVESVNDELRNFAYIVSHDLKAPLRGISTLASWLSEDCAEALGDQGKDKMALLQSRVGRMHDLIEGILQYSRVGRIKEDMVEINLNEVVSDVIDTIAPPDNISITIENELPLIIAEKTRAIQLFQNLLSNAIKYMDKPQGQVGISCVEDGEYWRFGVADNGPGIEEKHFERIFQIFQTVSDQHSFESTGVGLSVVKKIVDLYGGTVWVESEVGNGSVFYFTLPKLERRIENAQLETNTAC